MEFAFQIIIPCVSATVTGVVAYLLNKLKKHEKEREDAEDKRIKEAAARDEALKAGLLALCRDRILQGYRYYKRNGGISAQDLETMSKLYNAYHALGGNGTITPLDIASNIVTGLAGYMGRSLLEKRKDDKKEGHKDEDIH